jgi:ATP-binding cassette subfamily F protein 3
VLQCVQSMTGLQRPAAQNLLGKFLFSGWQEHDKPMTALSGGERRRLALAVVVASGANFLLFDEPTNHLDVESREALEAAVEAFPGTVLLVSHDRALLDAIADRTLAIEDGTMHSYEGGWADYIARRDERAAATAEPAPRKQKKEKKPPAPKPRRQPRELEELEAEIAAREEELTELERKLAEDWSDVDVIATHRRRRDELQELLARWENLFERSQA